MMNKKEDIRSTIGCIIAILIMIGIVVYMAVTN